jgi:hypothetical protein
MSPARSDLAILLVGLASLASWFELKRSNSKGLKWPAFVVILFYSTSFGNVFGISVIAVFFAQPWAIGRLIEIALMQLRELESQTLFA